METWQQNFLITLSLFSILGFLIGFSQSKKGRSFYNANIFQIIGAFVWGDAVVFGLFWFVTPLVILFLNNWDLFLVTFSIFWLVRSLGETQYWFLQQFSTIERNPPKSFWFYKYFKNDSVWFVWQIYWQCHVVVWSILTIYTVSKWLGF